MNRRLELTYMQKDSEHIMDVLRKTKKKQKTTTLESESDNGNFLDTK